MRITKLKLTAAVVATTGLLGLAGVGTAYVLGQVPPPRSTGEPPAKVTEPPKTPPVDKDPLTDPAFTAFPDLKPPDRRVVKGPEAVAGLLKMCPRILGDESLATEAGDDTYRQLLKAQLIEGRRQIQKMRTLIDAGRWQPQDFSMSLQCLVDMRNVASELWGNDPKALIPWLEEFVVMGNFFQEFTEIRVNIGTDPPQNLEVARRHRLAAEAALWKAKKRG